MDETQPPRAGSRPLRRFSAGRARGLGTLAVAVIAAFATIATSPPEESVRHRTDGPRVELTAEQPEITVPIEVMASPEAEPAAEKRSTVFVQPIWSAVNGGQPTDGSTPTIPSTREVLELSFLDAAGGVLTSGTGENLSCNVAGCGTPAAVRFHLLDPSVGRFALNWDLEVDYYFGAGGVPANAEIGVEFGDTDSATTSVVTRSQIAGTTERTRYGFGVTRIQIHAPHGIPADAEVSFEPVYATPGVHLHGPEQTHEVNQNVAIRLSPPQQCQTGPCDWSLLVTGSAQWQLVAQPELDIEAGVAPVTPVELVSAPVSGELDIQSEIQSRLSASVQLDRSLVDGRDFDVQGPLVAVEFQLTWQDPDARLRTPEFERLSNEPGRQVVARVLDVVCDDQTCRGTTQTPVFFVPEDASGTVSWEARVFIPYLITGRVPDEGNIEVEVQS